eukprot:6190430-Pleurochrysis_carterae.AAC.2
MDQDAAVLAETGVDQRPQLVPRFGRVSWHGLVLHHVARQVVRIVKQRLDALKDERRCVIYDAPRRIHESLGQEEGLVELKGPLTVVVACNVQIVCEPALDQILRLIHNRGEVPSCEESGQDDGRLRLLEELDRSAIAIVIRGRADSQKLLRHFQHLLLVRRACRSARWRSQGVKPHRLPSLGRALPSCALQASHQRPPLVPHPVGAINPGSVDYSALARGSETWSSMNPSSAEPYVERFQTARHPAHCIGVCTYQGIRQATCSPQYRSSLHGETVCVWPHSAVSAPCPCSCCARSAQQNVGGRGGGGGGGGGDDRGHGVDPLTALGNYLFVSIKCSSSRDLYLMRFSSRELALLAMG